MQYHELTKKLCIYLNAENKADKLIQDWLMEKIDLWLHKHIGDRSYAKGLKLNFGIIKQSCSCESCATDPKDYKRWLYNGNSFASFKFCPECGDKLDNL